MKRGPWSPVVGMVIECRYGGTKGRPGREAEILEVLTDGALRIHHLPSGPNTYISVATAQRDWQPPAKRNEASQLPLPPVQTLTEAQVREIVRDELGRLLTRLSGAPS
jgi:hypothetical protein